LAPRIVELMPPHHSYVEVFGGAAAVLWAKPPSPIETYNDIDKDLVNFFRVLRDPEKFARMRDWLDWTPYSRAEYYQFLEDLDRSRDHEGADRNGEDREDDDVLRAAKWWYVTRSAFSGVYRGGWSYSVAISAAKRPIAYRNGLEKLDWFHRRMRYVQVECLDFRDIFAKYDTVNTLFYCDPPYIHGSRSDGSRKAYKYEMTDSNHVDLINALLGLKGKVVLSAYDHPMYRPLEEAGWIKKSFLVTCTASPDKGDGSRSSREEVLWISPNSPVIQRSLF